MKHTKLTLKDFLVPVADAVDPSSTLCRPAGLVPVSMEVNGSAQRYDAQVMRGAEPGEYVMDLYGPADPIPVLQARFRVPIGSDADLALGAQADADAQDERSPECP